MLSKNCKQERVLCIFQLECQDEVADLAVVAGHWVTAHHMVHIEGKWLQVRMAPGAAIHRGHPCKVVYNVVLEKGANMILAGPLPGGLGGTLTTTLGFTLKPHSIDKPSYSATHVQTLVDLPNFMTGRLRWKPSGVVQSDGGTLGLHTSLLYPLNGSVHCHGTEAPGRPPPGRVAEQSRMTSRLDLANIPLHGLLAIPEELLACILILSSGTVDGFAGHDLCWGKLRSMSRTSLSCRRTVQVALDLRGEPMTA